MSDDAQAPEARGNPAGGTPPRDPHVHDDVWAEPADSRAAQAQPPQSPPRDVAPPEPTQVDLGSRGTTGPSGSAEVIDPFALPEFDPPAPSPSTPGAASTPPASGTPSVPSAPSAHDQRTVTSFPATGAPATHPASPSAPSWADPSAPSAPAMPAGYGAAVPDPFAPPAAEPVPPPPIAPGPAPYGYPGGPQGGYAHSAVQPQPPGYAGMPDQGYYGWTGMPPQPANGMGVAGLVLGIISAVIFCLWPLAIGLGVLAVIFSVLGRGKAARGEATNPGHALAGLICGWAGILLGAGFGVLVLTTPYW
ncbi:DUF4190 domain-containing protein [Streptomyces sp. P9-A2]|uniref:DUF4190 domain-containing protein n=1 Tax=Streptomyces sp. P9-A2 TaxID=3072284 RepID=UPI002FCBA2A1